MVNRFVKIMIFSDLIFFIAFGFVGPIFAVFITDQIVGGTLAVVGFATGLQLILKSIFQIPISRWIDKNKGERDDFATAIFGSFMLTVVPLLYIFIKTPIELYLVQIFYGLASALTFPGWIAMFTRHIDKGRESFEWSAYSTAVSIGGGIAGAVGGVFVERFGFTPLFIIMFILNFVSTIMLFLVRKDLLLKHGIPKVARLDTPEKRGEEI